MYFLYNPKEAKLQLELYVPRKIYTKTGNKIYPLNIAKPNEDVLINKHQDKHKYTHTKNYIKVPDNCICLYYSWPAGKNQNHSLNNGIRYNYSLIPGAILLDKLSLNALGLLQAEMTKYTKRSSTITFTNSNPSLVNIVIEFLERLGITPGSLKWDINFNYKLKINENHKETLRREKKSLNFWLRNTLININGKHTKFMLYTGNKNYKNMRKDTVRSGSLRVCYNNIIIYQLILNLLENTNKIIQTKKHLIWYMQGLIAGEGDIKLTKTKSVDSVRIGCTNLSEKRLYKRYLNRLKIKSQIESNYVCINNQRNFIKLYNSNLLNLHKNRYDKFIKGLISYKYVKDDVKEEFFNIVNEIRGKNGIC